MTSQHTWKDELATIEGDLINKLETKVKAASTVAAVSGLGLSLLGAYVFKGDVPVWVQALIDTAVTGGLTFLGGFLARHTPRTIAPPDPPAGAGTDPAPVIGLT